MWGTLANKVYHAGEILLTSIVLVPSRMIPVSLVYKKGLNLNINNPVLIDGYVNSGVPTDPKYGPNYLPWLERGGVYAYAHVRGGGEFGEDFVCNSDPLRIIQEQKNIMTALFKMCFIAFGLHLFADNNCDLLSNGNYRFIQILKSPYTSFDKWIESRVIIDNNNFSQRWANGDSAKGNIEWIYDYTFKLDYQDRQNRDRSEFGKVL